MNAQQTAETLTDLFAGFTNVEIEDLYQDADGWEIPSWKVEDRADEIASSTVNVSICQEANDNLRRSDLASLVEAQAAGMIAAAQAAGIVLVMQDGDINIRSGVKIVLTANTTL